MKALTVQQPWAWAIVHGGKTVENRTQLWKYRGPLAIHAGTRVSERGLTSPLVRKAWTGPTRAKRDPESKWTHQWIDVPDRVVLTHGAIVGVVELVDAHVAVPGCCDSPWAEYSYAEHGGRTRRDVVHLVLKEARHVDPICCKGRLGLWTPDADVLAQLEMAVAR